VPKGLNDCGEESIFAEQRCTLILKASRTCNDQGKVGHYSSVKPSFVDMTEMASKPSSEA
jgi:hypothetical protein